MTFQYRQTDGHFEHNGQFEGTGYSGTGAGRNNPAMEAVAGVGPLPRGRYKIGPAYHHPELGPCVMNLDPVGHDAHGRSLFRIHGNNKINDASHGCIILGPAIRDLVAKAVSLGDTELEVV